MTDYTSTLEHLQAAGYKLCSQLPVAHRRDTFKFNCPHRVVLLEHPTIHSALDVLVRVVRDYDFDPKGVWSATTARDRNLEEPRVVIGFRHVSDATQFKLRAEMCLTTKLRDFIDEDAEF